MSQTHNLKTWPVHFDAVRLGIKPFEVRLNDRGFAVDDILRLQEWDPEKKRYTGREVQRRVSFMLVGEFGIPADHAVMGLVKAEGEIAAMEALEEALRSRDFYEESWKIAESCEREMRESLRRAGFCTQYWEGRLHTFAKEEGPCILRDRLRELLYRMARHIYKTDLPGRLKADDLLKNLKSMDRLEYRKRVED